MKYYSLKELQTNNFDDKEILDVFNNGNFVKSSIISMFRFINLDYSDKEILNIVSKQNWMNSICWTWKDHDNFIIEMAKVYTILLHHLQWHKNLFVNLDSVLKIQRQMKIDITNDY